VIVWIGIAIFGVNALGAPVGVVVNSKWGFIGVAVATIFIPLFALSAVAGVKIDGADAPAEWVKVILPTGEGRHYTIRDIDLDSGTLVLELARWSHSLEALRTAPRCSRRR